MRRYIDAVGDKDQAKTTGGEDLLNGSGVME